MNNNSPLVEIMEMEEPGSFEFTSFTDFVLENAVENLSRYWPQVEEAHKQHGLSITFNQAERSLTLSTTAETRDPHIIHKARALNVLATQFGGPVTAAYKGLYDSKWCYELIQTGYQDGGIAAIHGLDKAQYVVRCHRLFKHARVIAELFGCRVLMSKDCMVVYALKLGLIKKFKSIVEKCILEDLDPTTLEGFVRTMDNKSSSDKHSAKNMEIEQQGPGSVEFTSFTDFVLETAVEDLSRYWPKVERAHRKRGLSVTFNQAERSITVSTTAQTTDPDIIHMARASIVRAAQFGNGAQAAYRGFDSKRCYEFIQTGYQDTGIAAIHGLQKKQYVRRSHRLYKHARVIADMCSCDFAKNEDSMLVCANKLGHLKKFRRIVEKCILEDLDPAKLKGFETWKISRLMKDMSV